MEGAKRRFLVNSNCQQLDSNYHKNILVEEREFVRIERKLKEIGPQGGRGWTTTGTTEDNLVMVDY